MNEAARANKAKVASATKADERVPRKRTRRGSDGGAPKKNFLPQTLVMRQSDREIMILAAVASLLAVVAEVAIAF